MRKNPPRPFPRFVHYERIVLPLDPDVAQRLTVVDKGADRRTSGRELIPVRFSRLDGRVRPDTHIDQPLKQDLMPFDLCRRTAREDCLITSRENLQFSQ